MYIHSNAMDREGKAERWAGISQGLEGKVTSSALHVVNLLHLPERAPVLPHRDRFPLVDGARGDTYAVPWDRSSVVGGSLLFTW
jgi:hypothetical protein